MQQADFEGIFEAMAGLPVMIRLLDPPLHEFLPRARRGDLARRCAGADRRSCTRRTRCWARAAAGSGSSTRRSTRCRCGRSCARPRRCASAPGRRRSSRSCIPLVGFGEELARLRELTERVAAEEPTRRVPVRDDDRAPARMRPRRRDRRGRRLLLVRDERPDADDARVLARRRGGQVPDASTSSSGSSSATRSRRSTRRASGS